MSIFYFDHLKGFSDINVSVVPTAMDESIRTGIFIY